MNGVQTPIGVVGARQTQRNAASLFDGVFQPFLVLGVDVERRVGEDEVEAAGGVLRVVVIAVRLAGVADVAFEAMHGEVQAAEATGFIGLLNAVDGEFRTRVHLVFRYEAGGGDKNAARAASGVDDAP